VLSTRRKIEIARVLNFAVVGGRSLLGRSRRVTVKRHNVYWNLDLNEGVDFAIYLGLYQRLPRRVARWIKPGALVVDIGANIGSHTLPLARAVGYNGRVIAVEPSDYGFTCLKTNATLNPDLLPRLLPVQAALTAGADHDNSGAKTQFYSRWPLKGAGKHRHARHLGELETAKGARFLTFDALLRQIRAEHDIDQPVAFIKLDVDGSELEVLRGATHTLDSEAPTILIELAPHVQDEIPRRFEELLKTLQAHGYRLESSKTGKRLPMSAPALRALIRDGASIDAIAFVERRN
jgi:FkbM family methyltransferase